MEEESAREFAERKMRLILTLTSHIFEERATEFLKKEDWTSFEEVDEWFDKNMKMYDELRRNIRTYYANDMYS